MRVSIIAHPEVLSTTVQSSADWCNRMLIKDRPVLVRYTVAIVLPGLALGLTQLIPWRADPSHFSLFFIAVMLSSWYGGLGAGLVATVLSALSLEYFFISKLFIPQDWHALLRVGVFTSIAVLTSYLTNARKRAEQALREAHAELDQRVRERTAELAQANTTMREEIAERKRAETELLRLQLELGRVERLAALGRMAGTIAHDLGTPLNSVLGYTQLLSQEDLTERARRRVAIIEAQINRMGDIIQRYLSQSRGSAPKSALIVNELVRDTLLLLQPVFEQRGIEVTSDLADATLIVHGNGDSIQRVLINLLDNAMDACEKKGAIKITTKECPALANKPAGVAIDIADSGAGIAPEVLPRIFDLFVTTKPPGRGTGLGLVICQEIIRAHGGTINIASHVGEGTSVSIYLPVEARPAGSPATEENNERANLDSR
jgi:C4-dicarboxylate-specific signal transduction histidine kinase